jgi:ribosomal-protein-alanine N-acetyltransferase
VEAMPYWAALDSYSDPTEVEPQPVVGVDWRVQLPTLVATGVTLRPLQQGDAPSLVSVLARPEITRFISSPPETIEGFDQFIAWTQREQAAGRFVCFGIVPDGFQAPIGLIQIRARGPNFAIAEWGFALGFSFWGTGLFIRSAKAVIDFAMNVLGVHRLEARAMVSNGRGNGALRKLGATKEGTLRKSMYCHGRYRDQFLWAVLDEDWRRGQRGRIEWVH